MSVKPIPDGYDRMIPSAVMSNAAEAIEFYKKAFGAEEIMRMPSPDGKIMHAELRINGQMFILNDELTPESKSPKSLGGASSSILLYVEDSNSFFDRALKAGATVVMPLKDMFWGDRWGMIKDPEGHLWAIATHIEDVTPAMSAERLKQQNGVAA